MDLPVKGPGAVVDTIESNHAKFQIILKRVSFSTSRWHSCFKLINHKNPFIWGAIFFFIYSNKVEFRHD